MTVRALARVNLAAIQRNVALLSQTAGSAQVCAVVKADGYGHGALPSALAAQDGGASWIAVATASEAQELRAGGLTGPLLILGALSPEELAVALQAGADVVAWREDFVAAVAALGGGRVHAKLDSGMGRLGTRDPEEARRVAAAAASAPGVQLAGLMTHFATADELGDAFFDLQLERFRAWAEPLREDHPGVLLHAANSAATFRDARAHFDLVRPGIAVYGMDPFGQDARARGLEPALELCSYVAEVKPCAAGESTGYGRKFIASADTTIATVPIGYGDGWRRALTNDADVLITGRRHPLVGTVSMDNITIDLGPGASGVLVGEEAVLIGERGGERISAEEIARRLDTINYEVTCGLGRRIPRAHHRDGVPAEAA